MWVVLHVAEIYLHFFILSFLVGCSPCAIGVQILASDRNGDEADWMLNPECSFFTCDFDGLEVLKINLRMSST